MTLAVSELVTNAVVHGHGLVEVTLPTWTEGGSGALIAGFQDMTRAVLKAGVPVVAALNGLAVGGAAELTLACDARVGSSGAGFYFPENGIGLTISNASTTYCPALERRPCR